MKHGKGYDGKECLLRGFIMGKGVPIYINYKYILFYQMIFSKPILKINITCHFFILNVGLPSTWKEETLQMRVHHGIRFETDEKFQGVDLPSLSFFHGLTAPCHDSRAR